VWSREGAWKVRHAAIVEDLYALSPAVHANLWRFLLDIDLVEELRVPDRPMDEPLRWMLADPRQLRTVAARDMLWAKLVDVRAALAARGYSAETQLVLEVNGPDTSEGAERYWLETGPVGGSCRRARSGEKTDLVLGLADLGAIYLGGCKPSELASAGRLHEARPGALARADAAFSSSLAPYCGTHF
jgi:predicted acetyltransferase